MKCCGLSHLDHTGLSLMPVEFTVTCVLVPPTSRGAARWLYPSPHHNQEPTFQLQVPRLTVTPKGVAKRHQDNGTSFFSPTPRRGAWLSLFLRTFLCLGSSLPVSDIISEEFRVVCTKGKNASHSSTFLYM